MTEADEMTALDLPIGNAEAAWAALQAAHAAAEAAQAARSRTLHLQALALVEDRCDQHRDAVKRLREALGG